MAFKGARWMAVPRRGLWAGIRRSERTELINLICSLSIIGANETPLAIHNKCRASAKGRKYMPKVKPKLSYNSYPKARKYIRQMAYLVDDLLNKVSDFEGHIDRPGKQEPGYEISPEEWAGHQRHCARVLIREGEKFTQALFKCKKVFEDHQLIDKTVP
jgi:hypothetical protein